VSIKDAGETWVRGAPGQAMILVTAVGIVLGGVAGLGAGFKIEQNRTRSDVKKLRTEIQQGGSGAGTAPSPSASLGQRIGKVTTETGGTITLATKRKGAQAVHTTATTTFEQLVKGSTADIVVGRRILVTVPGDAVIVLPAGSKLGRTVSSVSSDSIAIAKANNAKAGAVPMNKIKEVDTTSPATLAAFKAGTEVLAGGRGTGQDFSAVEVILLPAGSPFAN
jgi:hypothetical protein